MMHIDYSRTLHHYPVLKIIHQITNTIKPKKLILHSLSPYSLLISSNSMSATTYIPQLILQTIATYLPPPHLISFFIYHNIPLTTPILYNATTSPQNIQSSSLITNLPNIIFRKLCLLDDDKVNSLSPHAKHLHLISSSSKSLPNNIPKFFPNLTSIHIQNNANDRIANNLTFIPELKSLNSLTLHNASNFSPPYLSAKLQHPTANIQNLPNLNTITLIHWCINNSAIQLLSSYINLKTLIIQSSHIIFPNPPIASSFPHLKCLKLHNIDCTSNPLTSSLIHAPFLQSISFVCCYNINNLFTLHTYHNLRRLTFSFITFTIPARFPFTTRFLIFKLCTIQISLLKSLPNLRHLYFQNCKIITEPTDKQFLNSIPKITIYKCNFDTTFGFGQNTTIYR